MVPNELVLLAKEKVRLFVERAEDFAEGPYGEVLGKTFSRTEAQYYTVLLEVNLNRRSVMRRAYPISMFRIH